MEGYILDFIQFTSKKYGRNVWPQHGDDVYAPQKRS